MPTRLSDRGSYAALFRHYGPDHPKVVEARRKLADDALQATVEKLVADWPPFTEQQIENVVAMLRAGA